MGKKAAYFFLFMLILLVAAVVYLFNPFGNKIKSGLQVITHESNASLFLNDQYLDKTPYINKKILPGEYTLRIAPDDDTLAAYETQVTLNRGLLTVVIWKPGPTIETSGGVIYELEEISNRKKSEVSFVTQPDSAIIKFDNREQIFAPTILKELVPGKHDFEVTLPSYEAQQQTINLVPGHRLNIMVKLSHQTTQPLELQDKNKEETMVDNQEATTAAEQTPEDNKNDDDEEEEDEQQQGEESGPSSARAQALVGGELSQIEIKSTNFYQQGVEVLRVRDIAGTGGVSVGFVEAGQKYNYLNEEENGWFKIEFEDALDKENKEGWVSSQYAQLVATATE